MMKRREFMKISGAGLAYAGLSSSAFYGCERSNPIKWIQKGRNSLFSQVECDGFPLVLSENAGLLNVKCCIAEDNSTEGGIVLNPGKDSSQLGSLKLQFRHLIKKTYNGVGEDLLHGVLNIKNESQQPIKLDVSFTTGAQPSANVEDQNIYIPISATGLNKDKRLEELGSTEFLQDCEQHIGRNNFACHYLEPMAGNPAVKKTKALLLAPVIDISNPSSTWKIAMFTPSEEAYQFATTKDDKNNVIWSAQRQIAILPNKEQELNCFLFMHKGDASVAWDAFHQEAHYDEFETPDWLKNVKVHYYDFLSSAAGKTGLRGDGFEADIPYFKEFMVGLATQHGYYPYIGDFISPERKNWYAMQNDPHGPAKMSIQKMRDRIDATRKTGARAGIYMHTVLFDEASPLFDSLQGSILVGSDGQKKQFSWKGPDTVKQNWWMSFASDDWTNHLLKQAEYIMELLNPDAIVFDETFVCLGYEHHPDRKGPLSQYSIRFFKELRRLVHSYGKDKVVLTSDCGGSNMVMWADGDAGDHSYGSLLGNPLYRQKPIRYKAAIGQKPWVPCSWHFLKMWEDQMDLARKLGTAVGVSNGWIEFNGLHGLDSINRNRILKDIRSL